MKGNIWILKSWKFFACKLCNPESQALDSSIQLKEFLLVIGIQNPSSTDKESRIQFLESRATTDSRIQDRLGLPHMRRWFPSPWGGGGRGVTQLYTGFVPFFEQKIQVLYISHFSRTPSVQKSALSLCICQVFQNVSSFRSRLLGSCQFYPKGLSVFAPFSLEFNLNYRLDIDTMNTLYCGLVRPLLE